MEASVSKAPCCLTDASCRQLIDLVLDAASISAGAPANLLAKQLDEIAERDPAFRKWIVTQTSVRDAGSGSAPLTAPESWVSERLPELIASAHPPITCDDLQLATQLHKAAHVSVRLRATSCNAAHAFQQAQNESLYHFAYGLSHELNNPLANIATRAGVLSAEESQPDRRALLANIVENAMRGCEMLGDLMLIARPPVLDVQTVEAAGFFQRLVDQVEAWTQRFSIQFDVELDFSDNLSIDPSALREALWSLIRNAIEAQPDGGKIGLWVGSQSPDQVKIVVDDRGPGLSSEALAHCFDPYYSGREAGRGLGMGLAKARRIVQLHRGQLEICNLPGGGCSATVWLPIDPA